MSTPASEATAVTNTGATVTPAKTTDAKAALSTAHSMASATPGSAPGAVATANLSTHATRHAAHSTDTAAATPTYPTTAVVTAAAPATDIKISAEQRSTLVQNKLRSYCKFPTLEYKAPYSGYHGQHPAELYFPGLPFNPQVDLISIFGKIGKDGDEHIFQVSDLGNVHQIIILTEEAQRAFEEYVLVPDNCLPPPDFNIRPGYTGTPNASNVAKLMTRADALLQKMGIGKLDTPLTRLFQGKSNAATAGNSNAAFTADANATSATPPPVVFSATAPMGSSSATAAAAPLANAAQTPDATAAASQALGNMKLNG